MRSRHSRVNRLLSRRHRADDQHHVESLLVGRESDKRDTADGETIALARLELYLHAWIRSPVRAGLQREGARLVGGKVHEHDGGRLIAEVDRAPDRQGDRFGRPHLACRYLPNGAGRDREVLEVEELADLEEESLGPIRGQFAELLEDRPERRAQMGRYLKETQTVAQGITRPGLIENE